MRTAVTGSIATDHLLTFDGRFAEQILPDQIDRISLVFLASDLQVRRGGTGANIAFGMAALGVRPLLVGSVGRDAHDYVADLAAHGVDVSGVRVSETLASPRFTCTTDSDHNQIGAFYPGAMSEAAGIDLAPLGDLDLVVVAPNDPAAMARHTAECRSRGIAFAADPSQTLSFLDGQQIKELVDGAEWLFTNAYESGLVHDKTGWQAADVLAMVRTRVTTHGAEGIVIERRGEDPLRVPVAPARQVAEPTGVGDAFRAGFLTAHGWGLDLERSAQVGAVLATHVVETVGTQEYRVTPGDFLVRLAEAYGDPTASAVAPHLTGLPSS